MENRRSFLGKLTGSVSLLAFGGGVNIKLNAQALNIKTAKIKAVKPVVISTWDVGLKANVEAWKTLSNGGSALDAAENGVKVIESSVNCCVGLGGNPDRTGIVTLDACIMDHQFNCGAVAGLERIKHPISVARKVMEKTPHVFLIGEGAQQFALQEGFPLESSELSKEALKEYNKFLKNGKYKPQINIENTGNLQDGKSESDANYHTGGPLNHDTISMLVLDSNGNLSGSCTTSGMKHKMRGRVGDSPIIGAALFVDNEVGACAATGQGEDVIRIAGSNYVVEQMRNGATPQQACKNAIERIVKIKGDGHKDIQVAFIAINNNGEVGAYCIQPDFSYAVKTETEEQLITPESYIKGRKSR